MSLSANATVHEFTGNPFDRSASAGASLQSNARSDSWANTFALQSLNSSAAFFGQLNLSGNAAGYRTVARLHARETGAIAGSKLQATAHEARDKIAQPADNTDPNVMERLLSWIPDPGTWAALSMAGMAFVLLMVSRVRRTA